METALTYEFAKLDKIDLKVVCWLYSESPAEVYGFLEYLADERYRLRGINLNVHKAFHQLADVFFTHTKNPFTPTTKNVNNKY